MATVRFILLGPPTIEGVPQEALHALRRQPKRVALLFWLAAGHPRSRRRDAALAMFWPESTEARGRAALSSSLTFLRRHLSAAVLTSVGTEEIGLGADVATDVAEFRGHLAAGRDADALACYGGDLLPHLMVRGAPDFERWVSAEREALRRQAFDAARRLADAAGGPERAVSSLQHARRLAPLDEAVVRELMAAQSALGDVGGALTTFEELVRELDEELELAPSDATVALAEHLRLQRGERASERGERTAERPAGTTHQLVAKVGSDPGAGSRIVATPMPHGHVEPVPRWKRPARSVMVAGVLLIALAGAMVQYGVVPSSAELPFAAVPAAVPEGEQAFYLAPFSLITGEPTAEPAATVLPGLLAQRLDLPGFWRTRLVAPQFDAPDSAGLLAGRLVATDGGLEVTVDVTRGGTLRATATATGENGELAGMADDLARELLLVLAGRTQYRPSLPADLELTALRAFLAGEMLLDAGRFEEAAQALAMATEAAPGFALASFRLGVAHGWLNQPEPRREALAQAWQHRAGLSIRDQLHLEGWWANFVADDVPRMEQAYRRLVAAFPQAVEGDLELADLLYHNTLWGHDLGEARLGFERVLARDPDNNDAALHLASIGALQRDTALVRRILVEHGPNMEGNLALQLSALAMAEGMAGESAAHTLAAADRMESGALLWLVRRAVNASHGSPHALPIVRMLERPHREDAVRALGHALEAAHAFQAGRPDEAERHFQQARHTEPRVALLMEGAMASIGHAVGGEARLRELRQELADLPDGPAMADPLQDFLGVSARRTATYLAGLVSIELGDRQEAERLVEELELRLGDSQKGSRLRAALALMDGHPRTALEVLGDTRARSDDSLLGVAVLIRARAYRALGEDEAARRWAAVELHEQLLGFLTASVARRAHHGEATASAPLDRSPFAGGMAPAR